MFIVGNIVGTVFWGAILAIVVVVLTYSVCRAIRSQSVQSVTAIAILGVLLLFAGAQTTMIVGALYGKGYVKDISGYANSLVSAGSEKVESVTDFEELRRQLSDQFPMAKPVLDKIDGSGAAQYVSRGHTVVDFVADNLRDSLNYYILRRVLWLIGFVVVAMASILLTGDKRKRKSYGVQEFDMDNPLPMEFDNYEL